LEFLPRFSERSTIWRGVKGNASASYKPGSKKIWWGMSSCTTDLESAKKFLGTGDKTLFNIHFECAYNISPFSLFPQECEIILPPGRYFEVLNASHMEGGLYVVELKEIIPPVTLITFNPLHAAERN